MGLAGITRDWAACARVIEHMLKIDYYREAPEKVLEQWLQEIPDFRQEMAKLIKQNPGLKGQYAEMFAEAWDDGRGYARRRPAEYDEDNDPQTTWKKPSANEGACCPPNAPTGSKT